MLTRSQTLSSSIPSPPRFLTHKRSSPTHPIKLSKTKLTSLSYWKHNTIVGCGLRNIGNTCFINSVLQCLLYIPPLKNYNDFSQHITHCKSNSTCYLCEYSLLSKQTQRSCSTGVVPRNILNNITTIASNFVLGCQEDAHEFLVYFISCLETSIKGVNDHNNIIRAVFGGKMVSKVQCGKCKEVSRTMELFLDVSLDITKSDDLVKAFRDYCGVEDLKGDDKYYCDKCKRKYESSKQMLFEEFPQILIVHLKRFDRFQRKIRKFVKFEFDYDLSEFCGSRKRKGNYSLRALVVHEGYSACSGHYYCYAKAPDDRWYCFNDSSVKCVSEEFLLTLKPYILFYEKIQ